MRTIKTNHAKEPCVSQQDSYPLIKELGLAALVIILCGCSVSEYKCVDGVLYMKKNGAWIQPKFYETNKCLPLEQK